MLQVVAPLGPVKVFEPVPPLKSSMLLKPPATAVAVPAARLTLTGVVYADRSRVSLPPPPLMEPLTEVPFANEKVSLLVPPTRLANEAKLTVPLMSPPLLAVICQTLAVLAPVNVLVPLPPSKVWRLLKPPPIPVAVLFARFRLTGVV